MRVKVHSIYNQFSHHREIPGEPFINLYVDTNCVKEPIEPNSIAVLIEPRSIQPYICLWMEENYRKFKYVFTHDSVLLGKCDNAKPILWGGGGGGIVECPPVQKTKNVSFVSSDKTMCRLHIERLELAEELKNNPLIDVMGTFDGGCLVGPEDIYQDYMFSVAYENYVDNLWFTEKICNCFANRVIPIYLGTPIIGKYFNDDGILQVRNNEDIKQAIETLNEIGFESVYYRKRDAIEDNYQRVQQYANFEPWFFKTYGDLLDEL